MKHDVASPYSRTAVQPYSRIGLVLTGLLAVGDATYGQASDYRVRILKPLGASTASCAKAEAFAINSDGVIVGVSDVDGSLRPTVWFPCNWSIGGSPIFVAWEPYDLGVLSGMGEGGEALDINDDRVIVGYQYFTPPGHEGAIRRPFIWDLSAWVPSSGGGSFRYHVLDDFTDPGEDPEGGVAWGVNNESDPLIVGEAGTSDACSFSSNKWLGFTHRLSAPPDALTRVEPSTQPSSVVHAVTTANNPYRAAGHETNCDLSLDCLIPKSGLSWLISAAGVLAGGLEEHLDPLSQLPDTESSAEDINERGWVVGWQKYPDAPCRRRAAFWDENGSLTDLHYGAGFTQSRQTAAHGMSQVVGSGESELMYVVGEEFIQTDGVIWTREGEAWSHAVADALAYGACDIEVHKLNDVNASLWTVGVGISLASCDTQAVLLWHPNPCSGDVNLDGVVDATDLAVLLGAWGPWTDPGCAILTMPDLDNDGLVGATDLAILLGAWGTTCCSVGDAGLMLSQSLLQGASTDGAPLTGPESAIQALGFSSSAEFAAWFNLAAEQQREAATESLLLILNTLSGGGS